MLMRRLTSLTLVTLFLLSSLSAFYAPPAEAASSRGGSKDDFSIFSIVVGNQSVGPEQWVQPDGSVMDYVMQGGWFKLTENCTGAYVYVPNKEGNCNGHIATSFGGHECNVDTIGRTKITGYTFVMNKKVNVEFDVRNIIKIKR